MTVLSEYLVPGLPVFEWQGPAQDAAERLYAAGADVVFHAAGDAGIGVHRAAQEQSALLGRHLWSVGVDVDEWLLVDPDVRDHVLTSVLKRHDLAVRAAVTAYLDGTLANLTLGVGYDGFSLSESGGHLTPTTVDAVARAADALSRGEVRIAPHATTPATGGAAQDVTWSLRHDGTDCSGDLPRMATTEVGDLVTVEVANDSSAAVALDVWLLPQGTTWPDVADGTSLGTLSPGLQPWSGVVAAAGGRHAVSFEPFFPGVWGVTCHEQPGGGGGAVGLITADAVTGPVSATATATFTGQACTWEGPETMAVGDVVQVVVCNQSDVTVDFTGGMVVASTGLDDLGTRPFETTTRVRVTALGIAPGTSGEALLHVDRVGLWGANCTVQDGEVHHPAFLLAVDD